MLDYTKAAFNKTLNDFKRFVYVFNLLVQIIYIGYLVYAVCTGAGILWANLVLLAISVGYVFFYAIFARRKGKKTAQRVTKSIYKYAKIFFKAVTLGATVYGIYVAADQVELATIFFAGITTVGWVVSFIVTIIVDLFMAKWRFMMSAVESDINLIKRPLDKVSGIFSRKKDEQPEQSPRERREQNYLDELREEYIDEQKRKKLMQRTGK